MGVGFHQYSKAENIRVRWFAIRGINLQNLDEALAAGATRIRVVSAILYAQVVAQPAPNFENAWVAPASRGSIQASRLNP